MATASAAIIQPLAQQYRIGLTVDQLGVAQHIAREDLRGQRQAVANEVKRGYYLVLQAQGALDAVQEGVRSLRELDRVVELLGSIASVESVPRKDSNDYEPMWVDMVYNQPIPPRPSNET
jgi:hypothetical protein